MSGLFVSVMVIIVTIALFSIVGQRRHNGKNGKKIKKAVKGDDLAIWPFEAMPIMTDTEVLFFEKLKKAVPEYHVFSQVQLSRIIEVGDLSEDKQFWFNRICRQSIDYVIIDKDAQTTLLAIELDDWTHVSEARQRADDKKDKALASAGIPILRYHAEKMPGINILKHDIRTVIKKYW